jgi:uncharacterized protein (TIGR02598 family)
MKSSRRAAQLAFSLVEVTMAIGITSFVGLTVIGLLPTGLANFRNSMDISVSSQIVQRVVVDLQSADFSTISSSSGISNLPVRYFDDEGNELTSATAPGVVYQVAAGVNVTNSPNLATVVVDILNNPSNKNVARDPNTGGFATDQAHGSVPKRFSVYLARTQPL